MTENNQEYGWYTERGFHRNPFSLEPLRVDETITNAFVGREEEKADIKMFVQERSGATIVISEIGHGKSTIMNLAERYSIEVGKKVLRIDPRTNPEKITFFKALADEILSKFSNIDLPEVKDTLIKFKQNGQEQDLHKLMNTLKNLFDAHPSILIMDDLDKVLDFRNHVRLVKEIIDLLPKNIQVIATGDINQIMNSRIVASVLYQTFDFPIVIEEIDTPEKLSEFIYGRMDAFAIEKNNIRFDEPIVELLLDRTRGNLRETFRYLSDLLKRGKYDKMSFIRTMLKVDSIRLHALDDIDKKILRCITGRKEDIFGIRMYLAEEAKKVTLTAVRTRLDDLHQNCFVFKEKSRDSRKILYEAPDVMKYMLGEE